MFAAEQGNPPPSGGGFAEIGSQSLTVPVGGQLLVAGQWQSPTMKCGATAPCSVTVGLYVDGIPVRGAYRDVSLAPNAAIDPNDAFTLVGLIPVAAGARDGTADPTPVRTQYLRGSPPRPVDA